MFLSLQGLRGIAAILVVVHHYNEVFLALAKYHRGEAPYLMTLGHMPIIGAVGVPIFFVISGFVIALQSLKERPDGGVTFFAKRVARIVPIYWIMTIAFVLIEGMPFDARLVKSLLFVSLGPDSYPVLYAGWTLEYEMFFYLLFAGIVLSGFAMPRTGVAILLALIATLVSAWLITGHPAFYKIGNPHLVEFGAGIVAAYLIRSSKVAAAGPLFLTLGIAAIVLSVPGIADFPTTEALWGAGAFFIVLGLAGLESSGTALMKSAPFQTLGNASYSIYLAHLPLGGLIFPLVLWQWHLHTFVDSHVALAALVALAVAVGTIVYYVIERRLSQMFRNRVFDGAAAAGAVKGHLSPYSTLH